MRIFRCKVVDSRHVLLFRMRIAKLCIRMRWTVMRNCAFYMLTANHCFFYFVSNLTFSSRHLCLASASYPFRISIFCGIFFRKFLRTRSGSQKKILRGKQIKRGVYVLCVNSIYTNGVIHNHHSTTTTVTRSTQTEMSARAHRKPLVDNPEKVIK